MDSDPAAMKAQDFVRPVRQPFTARTAAGLLALSVVKLVQLVGMFLLANVLKVIPLLYVLTLSKLLGILCCSLHLGRKSSSAAVFVIRRQFKRALLHSLLSTCSRLLWLYGVVLCGPLRAILVGEIDSCLVFASLSTLFMGTHSPAKLRGLLFIMLGFSAMIIMDPDYADPYSMIHGSADGFNHLLRDAADVFGFSDHKAGIMVLMFALLLQAASDSLDRTSSTDLDQDQTRLQLMSSIFSLVYLLPFIVVSLYGVESHWYAISLIHPVVCVVLVYGIDFFLGAVNHFHVNSVHLSRFCCCTFPVTFLVAFLFFHSSLHAHHRISGGVVLATAFFSGASFLLTRPNSPKAKAGHFVGLSSSGLPMYVYGEDFLQRTSHSLVVFVKGTVKEIWCRPDSRRIFIFLCVNLLFTFVEFAYGVWTNSLGLISDAFHMLFDCSALVVGLVAAVMSNRQPTKRFSYGYARLEILSGFINGLFLLIIAFFIFIEALERLFDPPEVYTGRLLFVSVLGLLVNLLGIFVFQGAHGHSHGGGHGHSHVDHGHSHGGREKHGHGHAHTHDSAHRHDHGHSHECGEHSNGHSDQFLVIPLAEEEVKSHSHYSNANMQGVFLHVLADTLGSVAVIVSTLLIHYFGWLIADPICSSLLSILIAASVMPLLKEATRSLLLKSGPDMMPLLKDCFDRMLRLDGVICCVCPRVWTLKSGSFVCHVRLQATTDADQQKITQQAIQIMKTAGIDQCVVQVETESFLKYIATAQPTYQIKCASGPKAVDHSLLATAV